MALDGSGLSSSRRSASLQLCGLRKRFGEALAIDAVDLEVKAGEFLTLLGSSGSGKSTTLMAVAGFVKPSEGTILVNGVDQTDIPAYQRDIGLVFQHYALFPHLSVFRNVAFPLEVRKAPKSEIAERVHKALSLVRLNGFEKRKPSELSGGQQQRVALARALIYEPSILLLDEPLGALDQNLREEMQTEIRRIQQTLGITTIAVTHDQHEAIIMSDRIAVMRAGRIEQIGSPSDVYERPATRFVAEFMGASNFVKGLIVGPAGDERVEVTTAAGSILLPRNAALDKSASVEVVVRPERMFIAKAGTSCVGHWTARVTQLTYTGQVWRIWLLLPKGETLVLSQTNGGGPLPAVGDMVSVGIDVDGAWAVPAEA
jgi:putative spermidine/putrescine transport system ATP-binding protein